MLWKKAQEKTVKSHLSPVKICGIIKTHLLRGVSILPLGKGKSAYNLQRYRSGHNGADSKTCRSFLCLTPQPIDFTGIPVYLRFFTTQYLRFF